MMIPAAAEELLNSFEWKESQPGKTYRLDMDGERIYDYTDGIDAVKQAIYLTLNTERYDYLIYSWNYGVELKDLIGKPIYYAVSEIERRIREALIQDDRVTAVDSFSFLTHKNKIHVTFTVHTIYGDVNAERMVEI